MDLIAILSSDFSIEWTDSIVDQWWHIIYNICAATRPAATKKLSSLLDEKVGGENDD